MTKRKKNRSEAVTMRRLLLALLCLVLLCTAGIVYRHTHAEDSPAAVTDPTAVPESSPTASAAPSPTSSAAPAPTPTPTPVPVPKIERTYQMSVPFSAADYNPGGDDNVTGFATGWQTNVAAGSAESVYEYETTNVNIADGGSSAGDITFFRDGVPFMEGADCHIYFTASSTADTDIRLIAVDPGTGYVLAEGSYHLTAEESAHELHFTMTSPSLFNGRVEFQIGGPGARTVMIKGARVISSADTVAARVSQAGYLTGDVKRVTFTYNAGDFFDVINAETGDIVYCGAIVFGRQNDAAWEFNSYGDFTALKTPGRYFVRSQIGILSAEFTIADDPYNELQDSLVRMLSIQRCGTDTRWAGDAGHAECHTSPANVYLTETTRDVRGGWHDAGDYGRYVITGAKAVDDLLFAYLANPGIFDDASGIYESGNGIPDVLDEARYELEWMLKMQGDDGGVYNTVITRNLPGEIDPAEDTGELVTLYEETTTTAVFSGTMATAYLIYRDIDADFADTCFAAAERANNRMDANLDIISLPNPEDVTGGSYRDNDDLDGRFFMKMAMWCATGEDVYLEQAKILFTYEPETANSISWANNGGWGRYLAITNPALREKDEQLYTSLVTSLVTEATGILDAVNGNSYNCSLTAYPWGSNAEAANNGVLLSMAYDFTGNSDFKRAAAAQVSYILGQNPLDMCFVTGFGTNYPQNIHNRLTEAHGIQVTGALVGGPDSYHEDKVTENIGDDIPPAKMYFDEYLSYSTNEMAVYYNSALINLLARVRPVQ